MTTIDTKERILDAAERLFAEDGFDATSLRAVTAAAGVNLAAVNYHFGSKEALLRAVVRRIVEPVNVERRRRLEELEGGETESSLEELLDAFVSPMVTMPLGYSDRGPVFRRLLGRVLGDAGQDLRRTALEEVWEVEGRYLEAFGRVLPDLPPGELWWRFKAVIGVLVFRQTAAYAAAPGPLATSSEDEGTERARTITFLSAALSAPATVPPDAARGEEG